MKVSCTYPKWLEPSAPTDLVRVGNKGDGGYVLPQRVLNEVRSVLGMGLDDDWSFEAWIQERSGAKIAIFDHTVNWRFWFHKTAANFVKGVLRGDPKRRKNWAIAFAYYRFFNLLDRRHFQIGIGNAPNMVGLEQAMELAGMTDNILLKIDIEGAEYEILDAIVTNRKSLVACVIEFHMIHQQHHLNALEKFIAEMDNDFTLVHFHANNAAVNADCDYSSVIELSLITKRLLLPGEAMVEYDLPRPELDYPSVDWNPDVSPVFA